MKIKSLTLKNFRCFREVVNIDFPNLTAFVGKNDIGKSSILEALDIFFNDGKGAVKTDKDDLNKTADKGKDNEIVISVCFDDLPDKIVIDETNETTFESEYLLNKNGYLQIVKKYTMGTTKVKTFILANHPQNSSCNDLHNKTNTELKKIIEETNIECFDKTRNAILRTAIWNHYQDNLQLSEVEIDVTKNDKDKIYERIMALLPLYSLFQSDRKNSDSDSEIQDPLQQAAKYILNDLSIKEKLNEVAEEVEKKLREVSDRTLSKIKEMNPSIANELHPVIPSFDSLKWIDVFKKVSIAGDDDIPLNKRGSGIRRMILLNFFRAEAEKRKEGTNNSSIIYAIEEPETSQHFEHQKIMIAAFKSMVEQQNTQIILTTHSAIVVNELEKDNIRIVDYSESGHIVTTISSSNLPYKSLNAVNYYAFDEATSEYHNELYGFLEENKLLDDYKRGRPAMSYIQIKSDGTQITKQIPLSEYIRHQIHHPENKENTRFTLDQLKESINLMHDFIEMNTNGKIN